MTPESLSNNAGFISKADLEQHYTNLSNPNNFRGSTARASTISIRPEFNKEDYYAARPGERIQTDINDIIEQCENAYYQHGILRSIIELISEFVVDGLEIIHEDDKIQEFYRTWQTKVDLEDRAERFANFLYRSGNVVVQRYTAQLKLSELNEYKAGKTIAVEKIGDNEVPKYKKYEVPIKYFFYTPSTVVLAGDEIGAFSDKKIYGLKLNTDVISRLSRCTTEIEKRAYEAIPKDIREAAQKNNTKYFVKPLVTDTLFVAHYKKDDAQPWAYPLTYSVLPQLILNNKLKIAKATAFDNFRNRVGIWKLGRADLGILPSPAAADKLAEILEAQTAGSGPDVIWDDMLTYEEHYPPIEKFNNLQEDIDPILILFGMPDDIVGGTRRGSSGSSDSSLRVKNLAKKLQAGRREVKNWIMHEIAIIQRNMKFPTPPIVRFKNDDLMDERIYYTLLRELVDRNVISDQTMLERIEETPSIERIRIERETKLRDSGKMPEKASPFHKTGPEAQMGTNDAKNGRPPLSKDKYQRVRTQNKPKSFANLYVNDLYEKLTETLVNEYLQIHNISNARHLTTEQRAELEDLKYSVMAQFEPGTEINDENIEKALNLDQNILADFNQAYAELVKESGQENLTLEQRKLLKMEAYKQIWV